jgi:hypothetical protein
MNTEVNEIQATKTWLEQFVIKLNLCPFAAKPFREGSIHFALEASAEPTQIAERLIDELERLQTSPEIETTLLIIPNALGDFDVYWDFIEVAESIIEQLELVGVYQIASFHPKYCFEGVETDDPANRTNRSPYPMLHLLREQRLSEAIEAHPDVAGIPERNVAVLRELKSRAGEAP